MLLFHFRRDADDIVANEVAVSDSSDDDDDEDETAELMRELARCLPLRFPYFPPILPTSIFPSHP